MNTYRQMLVEAEAEIERLKLALQDVEGTARFCRQRLEAIAHQTVPLAFEKNKPVDLVGKPIAEAAFDVLVAAGRPMRAGDIARSLVAAGFPYKKSLSVTITSAIRRREDRFEKIDRGLFVAKNGNN